MPEYTPELGQAIFGQPHKQYELPDIWEAALDRIDRELKRVMWNIHQEEYESPFSNSGAKFECPAFSVHAYSWNDEVEQPWNFKWREVEISWYKHAWRGQSANMELTPDMAAAMLAECLPALQAYEEEHSPVARMIRGTN